ncbi:hypothetical protein CANTEDRAFT_114243 [Yamadazyma tenuis ATCC 10573]|uniref:Copper transport protein n=2 Tax=Candida tenuis TaxID=2315449 RepID=G3B3L3_CANTC|nr:uncharacterized protein CANTEDRAFT_114243 [Yamadazyma tenuis ATCC 10573]XP_006686732.1 uncharacterized protein CANTEDRAFT_114243 [Yamadazyma tenuis ATCC 10573]EGV64417.1 hypothetical protein CANTEDRAFT_114243 [Yamadazyma tenuis ATCC 10573]EGV64418.1 hypothetical protein CANTEDRAFT_114243 [Yamadazyma tenuis ATCC 10573]
MNMHMMTEASSSTMDMASSTSMASSTASSTSDSMDMDTMHRYFTTAYNGYPVLFKGLKAKNGGEVFGIFLLVFFVAVFTKFLEFARSYMEQKVWVSPVDRHLYTDSESDGKNLVTESTGQIARVSVSGSIPSMLVRNAIRLILIFLPEMFGFALMLVAMSFTLVYFFAVVSGLTVGKFIFERLGSRLHMVPIPTLAHHG